MSRNADLDRLEAKLTDRFTTVKRLDGGQIEVTRGRGLTASTATIDPNSLFERLARAPDVQRERLTAGYVSGVRQVLMEPRRSKAADWGFEKCAGRLMPGVEVDTFDLGAAAAGAVPWTQPYHEDLVTAYFIELDLGVRVLTRAQFERWGVTADRVRAAARSMLFHRSRNMTAAGLDAFPPVKRFSVGDAYDASRGTVVCDVFFSEFNDDFRFATPTPDDFLFVESADQDAIDALAAAAEDRFRQAEYPVSRSIYTFRVGKPVLDQAR